MAYYTQRGKNSWRLVVPMGYDARGKRRPPETKTHRVDDPALLRAPKRLETHLNDELTKFKLEVEAGAHITPGKKSFEAFVDYWMDKHVRGLEYKTRENYQFHCKSRIVPYFGSMYLDEITTLHLVEFMADLNQPGKRLDGKPGKPGSGTLVYVYRVLLSIFTKAVEWKALKDNPMDGINKPEENDKKKIGFYNESEIEQLIDALEKYVMTSPARYKEQRMMFQVLVILDLTTGMRRAELLGLSWPWIDLEAGTLEVYDTIPAFENGETVIKRPKNNEPRKFSLSPSVVEVLRDYKELQKKSLRAVAENIFAVEESYLFMNLKTMKPYYPSAIKKMWYAFHERNPQLRYITFHGLRHTATSIMISKNVHSKAIANRLGWKNSKMVDHYGHIFASVDEAAAAVFEDVIPFKKKKNG